MSLTGQFYKGPHPNNKLAQQLDILDHISDGFMSIYNDCNLLFINAEGARTFGHSKEDLIGKNLINDFPEFKNSPFTRFVKETS